MDDQLIGRNFNKEVSDHEKRIEQLECLANKINELIEKINDLKNRIQDIEELIYGDEKKGIQGIAKGFLSIRKYIDYIVGGWAVLGTLWAIFAVILK